jgi:hypothetical protein
MRKIGFQHPDRLPAHEPRQRRPPPRHTAHEAFNDGVLAIAITLLVLGLYVVLSMLYLLPLNE